MQIYAYVCVCVCVAELVLRSSSKFGVRYATTSASILNDNFLLDKNKMPNLKLSSETNARNFQIAMCFCVLTQQSQF